MTPYLYRNCGKGLKSISVFFFSLGKVWYDRSLYDDIREFCFVLVVLVFAPLPLCMYFLPPFFLYNPITSEPAAGKITAPVS